MSEDTGDHIEQPREADDEDHALVVPATAFGAMIRSEVEAQLAAAHRFPRQISRFRKDSIDIACDRVEVAESCIYTLERKGEGGKKLIVGPSIRLAEITAGTWTNIHVGKRIIDADETTVTAQGVAWDLQRNYRVVADVQRRITNKHGVRYSDDMVIVTGNAAASIGFRNAVFAVISRAHINPIFDQILKVAKGDAKTLSSRRSDVIDKLKVLGVSLERVLARLGKGGVSDIGVDDLPLLIGLGTSIKSGEANIDDVFPAPDASPPPAPPTDDGKRISLKKDPPNEGAKKG